MSKDKSGFTIDQHRAFGRSLRQMHGDLSRALISTGEAYPVNGSECRAIMAVLRALRKLKSVMDDAVARETPHKRHLAKDLYYGPLAAAQVERAAPSQQRK